MNEIQQSRLELLRNQALDQRKFAEKLQHDVEAWKELVKEGAATWTEAVHAIRNEYGLSLRYMMDMGIINIFKHFDKRNNP